MDSLGEFAQCLEHSQQGIAAYDPQQCHSHMFLYGNDTGVGCQMYQALSLWYLGYPDQALKRAEETLTLAHKLSHPFTLVFTLYYTARLHMLCREVGTVRGRAAMSLSRLWHEQGKKEKARKLLQEIYGWFTGGFETADLMEARALLDALA
ncbi:MAG: hypothetical protein P8186_08860 [Anaerolineae bacterium]